MACATWASLRPAMAIQIVTYVSQAGMHVVEEMQIVKNVQRANSRSLKEEGTVHFAPQVDFKAARVNLSVRNALMDEHLDVEKTRAQNVLQESSKPMIDVLAKTAQVSCPAQ